MADPQADLAAEEQIGLDGYTLTNATENQEIYTNGSGYVIVVDNNTGVARKYINNALAGTFVLSNDTTGAQLSGQ